MKRPLPPLALISVLLASSASAQRLLASNYTESDGLPTSRITDVRQAPDGEMVFATRAGLVRFDGTSCRPFFTEAEPPEREVRLVRFDSEDRAWVLMSDGSLAIEGEGDSRRLPPPEEDRSMRPARDFELLETPSGTMAGVISGSLGLRVHSQGRWTAPDLEGSAHRAYVIEPAFEGWFVGTIAGLFLHVPESDRSDYVRVQGLPPGPVLGLALEDDQRLWVLGRDWLGTLDREHRFEFVAEDLPPVSSEMQSHRALALDGHGGALYGTTEGLHHYDAGTGVTNVLRESSGLVSFGAHALMRDDAGLVWGATELGVFKILSFDARVYDSHDGLLKDEVTAIAERADGTLVFGHYGGLTLRRPEGDARIRFEERFPGQPGQQRVIDLHVDPQDRLWIAGSGYGVGRLTDEGSVDWTPVPEAAGQRAFAVHGGVDDELLVGTPSGLWSLRGGSFEHVLDGLPETLFVRRIELLADGTTLLATGQGLWVQDGSGWNRRWAEDGTGDNLYSLLEDAQGRVWSGGSTGLWRVGEQGLTRPGPAFAVTRPAFSLAEDHKGRLWIGTDLGYARSDGEELVHFDWLVNETGRESNRAAAWTDQRGCTWMGSTRGVTVFDPDFDIDNQPPPLEILSIEVAGVAQARGSSVRLSTGANEIVLRVRALCFTNEAGVEYRTRMLGFSQWQTFRGPTVHEARFTGLPAGDYVYQVQARAPGGKFGPVVSSPSLAVIGPLWKRTWFLALVLAASVAISAFIVKSIGQRARAASLHAQVDARTRELQSSLDELSKTDRLRSLGFLAAGIAHDLRNVLTLLTGNVSLIRMRTQEHETLGPYLDSIDRALERATQLSSQLQTFSSGGAPIKRAVSVEDLVKECAELVLSGSRLTLEVDIAPQTRPALADQAQIRQVIENLVLNARQCQPSGGWVRVEGHNLELTRHHGPKRILPPGSYVELKVIDGGPGMGRETLKHLFDPFFSTKQEGSGLGLTTAFSIVRRHGGILEAESTPGSGSTFRILLPAASPSARIEQPHHEDPRPAGAGRVLVVDDEAEIRSLLATILQRAGYEADQANGSREAKAVVNEALAEGRPVQYAILDHTLPGDCTGAEVLEQLHRISPELRAVVTSGYSDGDVLANPASHGFVAALPKPYRREDVLRTMSEVEETSGPRPA